MMISIEGSDWDWIVNFLRWLFFTIDWKWFISIFLPLGLIVWRVNEEFKASRELQAKTVRDGFHLELYKDISAMNDLGFKLIQMVWTLPISEN